MAAQVQQLSTTGGPKRVVILGGGFAGVYTAKYLTSMLKGRKDVEVELLSEENYFVFQPLLPEVAAGGISPTNMVNPIRELLPGARFRCCSIKNIDLTNKNVLVQQGTGLSYINVPYDHLVFCMGKVSNFASMPGVAEHALAMKDLGDAFKLRNHVITCLEHADIEPDPQIKKAMLTFAVAGGGFSGVETIGELCEMVSRSLKYFTNIRRDEVSFKLIHAQEEILPEMPVKLRAAARKILEKRGIEFILNKRVKAASPDRVYLNSGDPIMTRTFVCTVGNAINPVARMVITDGHFEESRMNGRAIGLFATDKFMQCIGKSGYWAVGDCAGVPNPNGEGLCPPTAQFAIRQGKACARNILASIDGKERTPFQFKALGSLASLGQHNAVADLMGVKLTGFIAWVAWRAIYLMKLPGLGRQLRVLVDWILDLLLPRDITQLRLYRQDRLKVNHHEPGELIITKGQIGRELYMISSGQVEVFEPATDGKPEEVLITLKERDVFGELALLEDTPRSRSVRSKGPVDVVVMSRADFVQVVKQFAPLEKFFHNLLRERYPDRFPSGQELVKSVADDSVPTVLESPRFVMPSGPPQPRPAAANTRR